MQPLLLALGSLNGGMPSSRAAGELAGLFAARRGGEGLGGGALSPDKGRGHGVWAQGR